MIEAVWAYIYAHPGQYWVTAFLGGALAMRACAISDARKRAQQKEPLNEPFISSKNEAFWVTVAFTIFFPIIVAVTSYRLVAGLLFALAAPNKITTKQAAEETAAVIARIKAK